MAGDDLEFVDEADAALDADETAAFSDAVLYSSDWTVETIVRQMVNKNIEMNPRFQRRDAWSSGGKGRFIESIILGFPIPQIVLAEKKGKKGQFIVLDGKQRLLSLLQFTGNAQDVARNGFRLSGLEVRSDLSRKSYKVLEGDPNLRDDFNAFMNNTIRTVVIRNWPNTNFLHTVFLRLNTGSVKLSPQELRQAMVPGPFTEWVDDTALASKHVQMLLGRSSPDPRMRDVELMVRFLAFHYFLPDYGGRMKSFLDDACIRLNNNWPEISENVSEAISDLEASIDDLVAIFGIEGIARKPGSRSFNRAIFDALVFYASDADIRAAMREQADAVRAAYGECLKNDQFVEAVESDTAGIPHTFDRLSVWGEYLRAAIGQEFNLPTLITADNDAKQIRFDGFR